MHDMYKHAPYNLALKWRYQDHAMQYNKPLSHFTHITSTPPIDKCSVNHGTITHCSSCLYDGLKNMNF